MKGSALSIVIGCAVAACTCRASAQGFINLKWNDCSLGPTAAVNQNYACDQTSGFFTLIPSFDPGANYTGANGVIADWGFLDVLATSPGATDLPEYWKFQPIMWGGCGNGRMTFAVDFAGLSACEDMWSGTASTSAQFGGQTGPAPDGIHALIQWVSVVPTPSDAVSVSTGHQYYAERIQFSRDISACPGGCADWIYLIFSQYRLYLRDGTVATLYGDAVYGGAHATWQNAAWQTPTQSKTWGQVKALYK